MYDEHPANVWRPAHLMYSLFYIGPLLHTEHAYTHQGPASILNNLSLGTY